MDRQRHTHDTEDRPSVGEQKNDDIGFTDKLHDLLPGVEFAETAELVEARTAVLEALANADHDPALMRTVWGEYAKICEQAIDATTPVGTHPQTRARLQIASLVHKALIFREAGNMQRYGEDLADAEDYAFAKRLDTIADTIGRELDSFS